MEIPMSSVTSKMQINVTLTGVRTFAIRMWLGVRLIKLAAFVMGVGIHVDTEHVPFERRDRRKSL